MSGDVHTPTNAGPEPLEPAPAATAPPPPPAPGAEAPADDRPEILVGAAFAGGLISALILKRLARDDD
jgi:hypothetical protein